MAEISLIRRGTIMKKSTLFLVLAIWSALGNLANASPTDNYYANMTRFEEQAITLMLIMSESEGIDITFPIVNDETDNCHNRTITAAPPAGSTPYYKDFEIKVTDYSQNQCDTVQAPAPTFATLKSYEVRKNVKTLSNFYAEKLQVSPKDH